MKERTFNVLLDSVEKELRRGRLRIGDRLPGERTLAEKYGISRASVREALQILSAVGLIRSNVGSGPKAGAIIVSEPSDALSWALRMHIATKTLPVGDVVTTRVLLEGRAAQEAASAPLSDERNQILARCAEYLDEMDSPAISNSRFHFCDTRFHSAISSLSNNIALETVIDSLHLATVSYVEEAVPYLRDWEATKVVLQAQHRGILEAVQNQDPDAAQARVAEHIQWFYGLSAAAQEHREYQEKLRV